MINRGNNKPDTGKQTNILSFFNKKTTTNNRNQDKLNQDVSNINGTNVTNNFSEAGANKLGSNFIDLTEYDGMINQLPVKFRKVAAGIESGEDLENGDSNFGSDDIEIIDLQNIRIDPTAYKKEASVFDQPHKSLAINNDHLRQTNDETFNQNRPVFSLQNLPILPNTLFPNSSTLNDHALNSDISYDERKKEIHNDTLAFNKNSFNHSLDLQTSNKNFNLSTHDRFTDIGTTASRPYISQAPIKRKKLPWGRTTLPPPDKALKIDSFFQKPFASSKPTFTSQSSTPQFYGSTKNSTPSQVFSSTQSFKVNSTNEFLKKNIYVGEHKLSDSQVKVVDAIFNRRVNVFFTGSAGTGKSLLLRYIIEQIKSRSFKYPSNYNMGLNMVSDPKEGLAITASTGIAAFNIGGSTIHAFAGIGLGDGPVEQLVKKVNSNRKARQNWISLEYLIIDEVSMLDGELFGKLDKVAQVIRSNNKPFGGVKLILAGDFFQLPPVSKQNSQKFCFESPSWVTCIQESIVLTQIFRQKDSEFSTILNEARIGELSAKAISVFIGLSRPINTKGDGIQATELYSTRYEVDNANKKRLNTLPGEIQTYISSDSGKNDYVVKNFDNFSMYPKVLELKLNAQVMLIKNMTREHSSLVNGSLGVVIGFEEEYPEEDFEDIDKKESGEQSFSEGFEKVIFSKGQLYPKVRFSSGLEFLITPQVSEYEIKGEVQGSRSQLPLLLAWALSIHKSQGQTLERVKVDLGRVFEKGQAYVALSRATTLEGLQVLNFRPDRVKAHPKVVDYYKRHQNLL